MTNHTPIGSSCRVDKNCVDVSTRKISTIFFLNSRFYKANQGNQQICRKSGSATLCLNAKFQKSQYCFDVSVKISFFYNQHFDFGCVGGEKKFNF
jgi:hypothetical protein